MSLTQHHTFIGYTRCVNRPPEAAGATAACKEDEGKHGDDTEMEITQVNTKFTGIPFPVST